MSDTQTLQDDVVALGVLVGLLTKSGSSSDVNLDWFKNPSAELETIGQRLDQFVFLLNKFIGPGIESPPPVFSDAQWYQIPNPDSDAKTPFFIVAPEPAATSGQIGLGLLTSVQSDDLAIDVYVYIPFFHYSPAGSRFIATDPDSPSHIGCTVTSKNLFKAGGVSFSGIDIDSQIYFSSTAPTIRFEFLNLQGTAAPAVYTTLQGLIDAVVSSWINVVVARTSDWLNTPIGDSRICPGDLLVAASFLSKDDDGSYSLTISTLTSLSPSQIALNFVFGVLNRFCESDTPPAILELAGGGLFVARRSNSNSSYDYGLRLAFDIAIPVGTNTDGTPTREVTLSFGSWLTGEDDPDNWMLRSNPDSATIFPEPGVTIYLLNRGSNDALSFRPAFSLASIGLNIAGANQTQLFNSNGYSMQGAEIRGSLDSAAWTYGAACRLDGVGIPLGSGFNSAVSGSGGNPVAQNILSSGSPDGGGDQDPVNPAFSLSAAYVQNGEFIVQFYDANGNPTDVVLFPINRSLGPLQCQKLGIGWVPSDSDLSFVFDGSVQLAALNISLDGLSIGIPVTTPADFSKYDLDLNGMGVTFDQSNIELSATLMKVPPDLSATPPRNYIQYDGAALLKGGTFTVSALGSYAVRSGIDRRRLHFILRLRSVYWRPGRSGIFLCHRASSRLRLQQDDRSPRSEQRAGFSSCRGAERSDHTRCAAASERKLAIASPVDGAFEDGSGHPAAARRVLACRRRPLYVVRSYQFIRATGGAIRK